MTLRTLIPISFIAAFMLQGARAENEPDITGQPMLHAAQKAALNLPDNIDAATEEVASDRLGDPGSAIYSPFANPPTQRAPRAAVASAAGSEPPDLRYTWAAMLGSVAGLGYLFRLLWI